MFKYTRLVSLITLIALLQFIVSCNSEAPISSNPKIAALKLPKGFKADHLYSPGINNQGSWVSMTFDHKGRMIASDQYGNLYRLVIPAIGADTSKEKIQVSTIELHIPGDTTLASRRIGYAQGLLYAFNSLYVVINDGGDVKNSRRSGIYRMQDTDNDDQYDKITLLKRLEGDGEHGPHSIVLSPDGKSLYVIAGNFTKIPEMNNYTVTPGVDMDNLLPLTRDPNGHDNTVNTHGGWIAQFNPEGTNFNLISAGFRNPYDLAFNEYGDIFTFDSDMEWDFGSPWYRPIRICQVPSGGEFGWRPGTDKWSPANTDNLPPLLNIGQGSPTAVFSGSKSHFPEKYKRSIFAFDWSFGIMYAIQPIPEGAHYTATAEEFISGSPLPLTDGIIGPDGAMYFLTGGRRIESDLYRVYFEDNKQNTEPLAVPALSDAQQLRKKLETFHYAPNAEAVTIAWPALNNEDRFIRYAARIAMEHQPAITWKQKLLTEKDPVIISQAAIALARMGEKTEKDNLLKALSAIDFSKISESKQLDVLRAIELILIRLGKPSGDLKNELIAVLDKQYPAATNNLNRSLSKIMVYMDAPTVVAKTMELMKVAKDDPNDQKTFTESTDLILRNPQYGLDIAKMLSNVPPQHQTYFATVLSHAKIGWTPALQETYFKWFYTAFGYKGGVSFIGFLNLIRKDALKNVSKNTFAYYNTLSGDSIVNRAMMGLKENIKQAKGPGRDWEVDTALVYVKDGLTNRDFANGKAMFSTTLCSSCHAMGGEGGVSGPSLTQIGTRFSYKDMLTAIIEPNKSISDQFGSTVFYLKKGGSIVGKLISEDGTKYVIAQNPFAMQNTKDVLKKDVTRTRVSEISPMLPGLINSLNEEELMDLLAYLKSGGNPKDKMFNSKK